ncbi:protein POLAR LOCALIZATION DURING ASYMMETRIC DIVISION AND REDISTRIBUTION-like [Bidens hawaiensis]|uniref:protein POLAR LOCALIZATION DURING ASYMMETRIC DIVISION AND REDISTRIBUTION-like n=1 Tax=Bidens hawaiensis TaxID=980011 RepID=UPI00404B125A
MWQVLVAAAIAGSGYFAKTLLTKPTQTPQFHLENNAQSEPDTSITDESVFRFSSASSGSNNIRKKLGRAKGNRVNHERKIASDNQIGDVLIDDHKKNAKKFGVSLKKRRIGRNASAKCQSFDVEGKSSFSYGVGVGMMYMMSAGKAEIERLNAAIDETAKVVQELKAEISKRKLSCDSKADDANGFAMNDEGEYASSILTDEPQRDAVEMEQLEAELESELLKLQISNTSPFQNKASTEDSSNPQNLDLEFNQSNGVLPYELDKKLCHLLIEQQESQIVDLESELQHTNAKLVEKESELQALKDCVKRLSDFSVTCPSETHFETETFIFIDEESEDQFDEARNKMEL